MTSDFILAQIVGFIAMIVGLSMYQLNKRKTILRAGAGESILFFVHHVLLNAHTGAMMNIIAAARYWFFSTTEPNKRHAWVLYVFITLALLATALTWQGYISLLPLTANIANAIASWQKNPKLIRNFALVAPPFWMAYSLFVFAIPVLILQVFIMISILIGKHRLDHKSV